MSSSDRSENKSKADEPYDRMLIFLTGKGSEDRKSKEKAIRFPIKVRISRPQDAEKLFILYSFTACLLILLTHLLLS